MRAFKRVMISLCFGAIGIGILLVILGFSLGGMDYGRFYGIRAGEDSMNMEYSDVKKINFEIDYGKLEIKNGDRFYVEATNIDEELFHSEVSSQGELKLSYKVRNRFLNWGINVPFTQGNEIMPTFYVTLPDGILFEEVRLKMGAGTAAVDSMEGEKVTVSMGAGRMMISDIKSENELVMTVGAGEITADTIAAREIKADCGAGKIDIAGAVQSGGRISCGVGSVKMDLKGKTDDYGYLVSTGIGKVTINGESYKGTSRVKVNNNSENIFNLDCGVGTIHLKIQE